MAGGVIASRVSDYKRGTQLDSQGYDLWIVLASRFKSVVFVSGI